MRTINVSCDRCSRMIYGETSSTEKEPTFFIEKTSLTDRPYEVIRNKIDLCPYCQKEFRDWLDTFKPRAENTSIEEKET